MVISILFLFLFNFKTAFISAIAIPLSLLSAIIVMSYFNLGLNVMVLSGLAIALGEVVDDLCNLSTAYRKSRKDLESALESPPEGMPFRMHAVRDGCELILGGTKIDDIESFLDNNAAYREIREKEDVNVMKTLGMYAPAFGMIGTLIGLIFMLAGMGSGGDDIGGAMAVALITTLYGAFAANFLFLPFSDKLKGKNESKKIEDALTTAGVLLIAQKKHPIEIRDSLNAFLPPKLRKKEED
jgi:chemotaxis protein MotA